MAVSLQPGWTDFTHLLLLLLVQLIVKSALLVLQTHRLAFDLALLCTDNLHYPGILMLNFYIILTFEKILSCFGLTVKRGT